MTTGNATTGMFALTHSWRDDYLLRASVELARRFDGGEYVKARELSDVSGIPRSYVAQILGTLIHAGLVVARAGPSGGHRLAKTPQQITLLDIISLNETNIGQLRCVMRGTDCGPKKPCAIHSAWLDAQTALCDRLRSYTLADCA